jgi:hypothetical protein
MAMSKAMIDTTLTIDLDWQQAEAIETICAEANDPIVRNVLRFCILVGLDGGQGSEAFRDLAHRILHNEQKGK